MRPPVDVVVPFAGTREGLAGARERAARLRLGARDTLVIADNSPRAQPAAGVVMARGERSSYFARNRGAEQGTNPWLLFLDADVVPAADLLERYFAPEPGARTAVVAGGLRDAPPAPDASLAARFQARTAFMDTETFALPRTANLLVRRVAWAEAEGFAEGIRSGGDIDLWLRLRDAGWELERRAAATALHLPRPTLRSLAVQVIRHGMGAGWVEGRHPGTLSRRRKAGLALWSARRLAGAGRALGHGDPEGAACAGLEGLLVWLDELGRRLPNRAG